MRLTNYTDFSLRVLIYLAAKKPDELSNITEIANAYDISRNHLTKVIHGLAKIGVIDTLRGRGGGIKLSLPPEEINIGSIVRLTEEDFKLVPCFGDGPHSCAISPICGLKHALHKALDAYLSVLDQYTLADLVINPLDYRLLLGMENER